MRTGFCIFMAVVGVILATTWPVDAKIAPIPLPELVAKADFIGIVECVIAGETVAKYKVIESCRGAKAGEHIHIRTFVRVTGPQFRAHLCGERLLAIAPRASAQDQFYRIGASLPLAWRRLPADYEVPYGQGPSPLNADVQKRYEDAKKLARAKPKEEYKLPGPDREAVWSPPPLPKPSPEQLAAWRKVAKAGPITLKSDDAAKARLGLLAYDPTPIFEELQKWEAPAEKLPLRTGGGYVLASQAAHHCGQDREKHLKMLVRANDPMIRAVGAVYLCFENEKDGKEELARLSKLEVDAGGWAALALARRGDKTAVPRVLELFTGPERIGARRTTFHRNLCQQAMVLFSNSAQKSAIAPPRRAPGSMEDTDPQEIRAWWLQNADRIILHDPWLEKLARQKVD